ncbi:MAG: hypothetical protein HQ582_05155 [Planctomycetes bacterium]|nr:hypothetical protein [Planctomycetota bacterium]
MRLQTFWVICLAAVLTAARPASAEELERSEVRSLIKLTELGYKVVVPLRSDVPWRVTVSVGGPRASDANMGSLYFVPNLEKLYLCGNRYTEPPPRLGLPREEPEGTGATAGFGQSFSGVIEGTGTSSGIGEFWSEEGGYSGACPITDAGLSHLRALTKLKVLDTGNARITEAGLAHLKQVTSIEELNLAGNTTAGAGLRHLNGLVNLRSLRVKSPRVLGPHGSGAITDADLKHLENLTNLDALMILDGDAITDAGLEHLGKLTKLRKLTLIKTKINGEGLKHLRLLTNLQTLTLSGARSFSGEGLKHLEPLVNLQTLTLSGARSFSGEGLKHLEPLVNLETLELDLTPLTDPGLAELSALTGLKSLSLCGAAVTDAGLEHLKRLTALEELDLRSTQVTAGGLARHLSGMRNLKHLHVGLRGTSKADIDKLKQALPDTRIHLYH